MKTGITGLQFDETPADAAWLFGLELWSMSSVPGALCGTPCVVVAWLLESPAVCHFHCSTLRLSHRIQYSRSTNGCLRNTVENTGISLRLCFSRLFQQLTAEEILLCGYIIYYLHICWCLIVSIITFNLNKSTFHCKIMGSTGFLVLWNGAECQRCNIYLHKKYITVLLQYHSDVTLWPNYCNNIVLWRSYKTACNCIVWGLVAVKWQSCAAFTDLWLLWCCAPWADCHVLGDVFVCDAGIILRLQWCETCTF